MPRKIVGYACSYRCGYKIYTHKAPIIEHEKRCLRNPTRRACVTCKHTHCDGDNCRWWYTCNLDKLPDGKDCIVECEFHELDVDL